MDVDESDGPGPQRCKRILFLCIDFRVINNKDRNSCLLKVRCLIKFTFLYRDGNLII